MSKLRHWRYSLPFAMLQLAGAHALSAPTTIHVLRIRTSENHAASKFTYYTTYGCFLSQYYMSHMSEPEPLHTEHAKQFAIASAPPVTTFAEEDVGEVEEYFAPGRYARYQRNVVFEVVPGGSCALTAVHRSVVQIAQGTRLVNATTQSGTTKVSESVLKGPLALTGDAPILGATAAVSGLPADMTAPFQPGGQRTVGGESCDFVSSSKPLVGMDISLCVWRGMKNYQTPLGPKEVVLYSHTQPPSGMQMGTIAEPIVLDMGDTLRWTEEARTFEVDQPIADEIFRAPQATR